MSKRIKEYGPGVAQTLTSNATDQVPSVQAVALTLRSAPNATLVTTITTGTFSSKGEFQGTQPDGTNVLPFGDDNYLYQYAYLVSTNAMTWVRTPKL